MPQPTATTICVKRSIPTIRGEHRRLWRRLAERGTPTYEVSRSVDDIRRRFEEFLTLEAAGWKGRRGTAMAVDRYQAAFAREAVNSLAERDLVRIHTLDLDGRAIAVLVVFIESGEAWTWKTAFDESLKEFSPGTLLAIELLKNHLDDPNIVRTDSCAVPDHPVMSRLFMESQASPRSLSAPVQMRTTPSGRPPRRSTSIGRAATSPASCATGCAGSRREGDARQERLVPSLNAPKESRCAACNSVIETRQALPGMVGTGFLSAIVQKEMERLPALGRSEITPADDGAPGRDRTSTPCGTRF